MEPVAEGQDLRPLVALLFVPGLYLCLLVSAAVALAGAALLISLIYWLASYINRIPVGIILLLALGGLYGVWVCVAAGWQSIQKARVRCHAIHLPRNDAPAFWAMLDDLSRTLACPTPANVIVEFGTSFFVTEAHVTSFAGDLSGRTLCISAPLTHLLTPAELKAVLAHEFAHFTGQDTIYSRRFYPVYRGTTSALQQMQGVFSSSSKNSGWMALPLLVPAIIISRYLSWFSRVEARISREREARADRIAADTVGAGALGPALAKTYAFSPIWERATERWIVAALNEGKAYRNLSVAFAERFRADAQLLDEVLRESTAAPPHPTDSHPTLSERLEYLGFTEDVLFECVEEQSAACLFAGWEQVERQLTDMETALIASYQPEVDRAALGRAASSGT